MIHQLLYTSASRHPRGHSSDIDILQEAVSRNAELGITGYLLREAAGFCQLLEGDLAVVTWLFDGISRDMRHFNVIQRMQRTVPRRSFPGWSMGYGALSPEDSAYLSRCFAQGHLGTVLAFDRIDRLAMGS